ncbi:MAG: hypothetical protein IJP31_07030 [Lachnospiraceae bacterium]|nr:hypothetical protein [Lachnospiraceae bacterium]
MNNRFAKTTLTGQSFLAAWAIMRISGLASMDVIAFLFFFLCLVFFLTVNKEIARTAPLLLPVKKRLSAGLGLLFTCFYLSDIYLELVQDLDNLLFKAVLLIITALGLFFLFSKAVLYLMCLFARWSFSPSSTQKGKQKEGWFSRLPLLAFLACVLCRLPFLLYSWPGIMTPDSINQFEQVIGMQSFSNHHPWVHTLTISLFYHLGSLFTSSVNTAFVFYTLFQICFMALAVAYLVWVIRRYTACLPLHLGIIGFYALMPYNNVMAICIWKDVLFAGTVLFFCSALFHLLKEQTGALPRLSLAIYFLSGCLLCLYRSNGWYAFLISLPFLLIGFWKKRRIFLPLHLMILAVVLVVKGPVMNHYEVEQPDFVESISIPLQQVCRVVAVGKELLPDQEELLGKIMDISYIDDLYTEYISDNMKELVRAGNPQYLEEHKGEYLKLWLKLGLTYPDVYLDAYIQQTRGYYSPSAVYAVADVEGVIDNDTGLYGEYLIGGKILLKAREILLKLHTLIPLYGAFWSMGSVLWLTLLTLALLLSCPSASPDGAGSGSKKSPAAFLIPVIPWIPNLAVIATLLIATPVATEFRYAYHLVYCLPLYAAILLLTKVGEDSESL